MHRRGGSWENTALTKSYRKSQWLWIDSCTRVGGVDPEALVPEAAQEDEAVVCRDDETLGADVNALIQQVRDLASVSAHVTGCNKKQKLYLNLKYRSSKRQASCQGFFLSGSHFDASPLQLQCEEDLWANT